MTSLRNIAPVLVSRVVLIVSLVLAAGASEARAQQDWARITGQVLDFDTRRPLQHVHVFVASSMMGTTTDANGRFALNRVPAGAHRLVVSMVGYELYEQDSLFHAAETYELDIFLAPGVVELAPVTVSAREARRWQRRLIKFTRLLVGETDNSELVTLTNPEVLTFEQRRGKFTASATAPLLFENRALGYRLQYHLKELEHSGVILKWDGDPLFSELDPADAQEDSLWQARRREAFYGSQRHYLLALWGQRTEQEGFATYRRYNLDWDANAFNIDTTELLREGPTPLERELTFRGYLEVIYTGELERADYMRWQYRSRTRRPGDQRSFMRLNDGPTLIDRAGEVIDPYGVTVSGYFAFERIGDMIPKEYRPPGWPSWQLP